MRMEISVTEVKEIFKIIEENPEGIFGMMRFNVQETVGNYLTALMNAELTRFLGRGFYEHGRDRVNHRNGSYDRGFTLKGIGNIQVAMPRDRLGEYKTQVIPRSKRYEEEISRDLAVWPNTIMLGGIIAFDDYAEAKWPAVQPCVDEWQAAAQWESLGRVGNVIAFRRCS